MNFLSPMTIAIAAGLTIPPLLALYFLKLKRAVQLVPSTLLWKRTVEDLRVNAPFRRLRSSLLLWLQLLILILAAVALGKPMFRTIAEQEDTLVLLVDRSASMGVVERDGRTRLDLAKEQAKRCIDNMDGDARAMVIAFCDRATVVSSFSTDKSAIKRKIDSIEPTQSGSSLSEAISLAEAYAQNLIIGGEDFGGDVAPESAAPPATVFLFTDGRIEDADRVTIQKFDVRHMQVVNVGHRTDNVGIVSMNARRRYEQPEILEVTAAIQNFGTQPVSLDAVLYVDGRTVDIQTVTLQAGAASSKPPGAAPIESPFGSTGVVVFDDIEFEGGGVVEVRLRVDDALSADNRAWTVIAPPGNVRVLLVSDGNPFFRPLEETLRVLPVKLTTMSTGEYESAVDQDVLDGERSAFDVVVFEQHSTARLPQGNYLFFGAVPEMEGVTAGGLIDDEVLLNWDETHPILRHVAVDAIDLFSWRRLALPPEATVLIDGASSPILAYFTRDGSQFLMAAFGLIVPDEMGNYRYNTYWVHDADFIVFVYNVIQFLSSNVATTGRKSIRPGEPIELPAPPNVEEVRILRPDGRDETVPMPGRRTLHYARTRLVGIYRVEPGVEGHDTFAVNLFNSNESRVEPAGTLTLGAQVVKAQTGRMEVNKPAWPYFLIALLVLLLMEWVVYNHRVFV